MRRLLAGLALAAGAAALTVPGAGFAAGQIAISGTAPNGGCGPVKAVTLRDPSSVGVHVALASRAGTPLRIQVLDAYGNLLASSAAKRGANDGRWNLEPGTYGLVACTNWQRSVRGALTYAGSVNINDRTPTPLPIWSVLAAKVSVTTRALGSGAVRTPHGLVWFELTANQHGSYVQMSDPQKGKYFRQSLVRTPVYGVASVAIANGSGSFLLSTKGLTQHVTLRAPGYSISGNVVQGRFTLQ